MRAIQTICYVDFSGDLQTTACGLELGDGLASYGGMTTVYMSSSTCPSCIRIVQAKLAALSPASPLRSQSQAPL